MKLVEDMRRLGFRRWYERQLIESHAYLVTAFLALILLLAGIESLDYLKRSLLFYAAVIVAAAAAGTLMFVAWRRFITVLQRAELFAGSAECPRCKAWGQFEVIGAEAASDDDPVEAGRPHWVRVKCCKCGNDWRLG
jgi:phage FluMu protein Com